MDLRWYVCDLLTGRILDELPLSGVEKVRRRIALVETTTFTLDVYDPACPAAWDTTLVPGRTMLVLTIDDQPTQAWVVNEPTIGDVQVQIACATLEECLSRTNVPDLDPYGMDYTDIAVALLTTPGTDGTAFATKFGFDIDAGASGKTLAGDQTYSTLEDRSILAALNEDIMGAEGGPEWRIFVTWTDEDLRGFTKTIEILPRVGTYRPDAIFDLDADGHGTIESYTRTPSYAAGKGATVLIGTSEGSGTSRPMTEPQVSALVAQGWPRWEERKSFTGLDDAVDPDAELLRRTQALVPQREFGSKTWSIIGRDNAPKPGRDFNEGDTVPVDVAPQPPKDPTGGTAQLRTLGWEIDVRSEQVTLLFWENEEDNG